MRQLKGKIAIVTGASRGIGVAIARGLAAGGVDMVIAARSKDALDALAEELCARGVRCHAVACDLTDAAQREALIEQSASLLGRIDILINNAGVEGVGSFHARPFEDIQRDIETDLTAPVHLTRLVLPGMLSRRQGHIVNMASLAGKAGIPYDAVYSATKAALIGFTEALRLEYRGTGVGASVICPGFVSESGMYERMAADSGIRASRMVGTSSPVKVVSAVISAIQNNRGDVIVNPGPMRLVSAFGELAPGIFERGFGLFGADKMFEEAAKARGTYAEPSAGSD